MGISGTYSFIVNTASGNHRVEGSFSHYEDLIRQEFPACEIVYIREDDSISEVAQLQAARHSYIVACGGDGTVHQVINGLDGTDAVLGVLPLGSGNDLARAIGLSTDIKQNIAILKRKKVRPLDLIKANDELFINTFGIGADGLTNYYASKSKFQCGALRYFFGGMRALLHSSVFDVELSIGGTKTLLKTKAWMVTIANGTTEGGRYTISPTSKLDDGVFEVIVVKDIPRVKLLWEFIKLSFGMDFSPKVVTNYATDTDCTIKLSAAKKTHADGEQISPQKEYLFVMKDSARHIICNL